MVFFSWGRPIGIVVRWTWLTSPSFVLEVFFFVVFVRGMPRGHCDSMDVVGLSFLRAGGVLLRGVRSWNAPWAL